jgi:hypothetical protein
MQDQLRVTPRLCLTVVHPDGECLAKLSSNARDIACWSINARYESRPNRIAPLSKTIGIVWVAAFAASAAGRKLAAITAT